MRETFYKKVGQRYHAVREYDSQLMDSYPKGCHLVLSDPSGCSRVYNIDPNYAAMIAAGKVAEDVISKVIVKESSLRMSKKPMNERQKKAWEELVDAFGDDARTLQWPSAAEAARAAVDAMQAEAIKLMENPAVKNAFDQFQIVCNLTKDMK